MKYEFKEGEVEKPAIERLIQKTGHIIEFSMLEMQHDLTKFTKTLKELRGNREIKASIVRNVEMHHPSVKDIPEFDRSAIHMYHEAAMAVKTYDQKIAEIEKEEAEYKLEIEEVQKQIPELAPIVSPFTEDGQKAADNQEQTNDQEKSGDQKGE